MKFRTTLATAATSAVAAAVIGVVGAVPAYANADVAHLGSTQKVTDGAVVTSYTVSGLKPSNDPVNVQLAGKLWEATTTVDAVQGTSTPAIPFFNARAGAENYRVLFYAFAPQGLSGATLQQGGKSTGKIYFDVTGPAPTSVVYNDAVQDRLIWD
jgi:hypothetical protein